MSLKIATSTPIKSHPKSLEARKENLGNLLFVYLQFHSFHCYEMKNVALSHPCEKGLNFTLIQVTVFSSEWDISAALSTLCFGMQYASRSNNAHENNAHKYMQKRQYLIFILGETMM